MTMFDVGIINYGLGNISSVEQSIVKIGYRPTILSNPKDIDSCHKLILPGVGNFSKAKNILDKQGWSRKISNAVLIKRKPILGICLGMQLLANYGYEGAKDSGKDKTKGLEFIGGEIKHLKKMGCKERVPHMGWNSVFWDPKLKNNILKGIKSGTDFYFVHSFIFVTNNKSDIIAEFNYSKNFISIVAKDNIWGTQFHPEKSSTAGLKLLKNFMEIEKC